MKKMLAKVMYCPYNIFPPKRVSSLQRKPSSRTVPERLPSYSYSARHPENKQQIAKAVHSLKKGKESYINGLQLKLTIPSTRAIFQYQLLSRRMLINSHIVFFGRPPRSQQNGKNEYFLWFRISLM